MSLTRARTRAPLLHLIPFTTTPTKNLSPSDPMTPEQTSQLLESLSSIAESLEHIDEGLDLLRVDLDYQEDGSTAKALIKALYTLT